MRSKLLVAALVLVLVGVVTMPSAQTAQAGGGPTTVPWLRVYQIDPYAVDASNPYGNAFAIAFNADLGNFETIEVCHTPGGCSAFPPGYFFGGYVWGNNIQSGWTWIAGVPTGSTLRARAIMTTPDGRREQVSAEPIVVQPTVEASGEVWVFVDQAPKRLGESLKLQIDRDLGLPIIRSETCLGTGTVWSCRYEDDRDWGLLLNGAGTQHLDLALSHSNIVREGPRGKLVSFPNGASIMVRYTMVDGSSVSFQSDPMFFLP